MHISDSCIASSVTTLHDILSVRTFTKDAIAGAHKDRCGERLATTIAGHETGIVTTASMRGRCSASAATHKTPSRHGASVCLCILYASLILSMIMMSCRVVFGAAENAKNEKRMSETRKFLLAGGRNPDIFFEYRSDIFKSAKLLYYFLLESSGSGQSRRPWRTVSLAIML
jgi:hypothetical protein